MRHVHQHCAVSAFALSVFASFIPPPAVGPDAATAQTIEYATYNATSGAVVYETTRTVRPNTAGGFSVRLEWKTASAETTGIQEFVLDTSYATLAWRECAPHEHTEYTGRREGNELLLDGVFHGQPLNMRIAIDDKPFFVSPAVGLQGFVRSGARKMEFRTLRPSNLSEYKMRASVQKIESISVQGHDIEVVRIKWGLTGFRSRFFSRTQWFRRSDGLFVRSKPAEGEYSELVAER